MPHCWGVGRFDFTFLLLVLGKRKSCVLAPLILFQNFWLLQEQNKHSKPFLLLLPVQVLANLCEVCKWCRWFLLPSKSSGGNVRFLRFVLEQKNATHKSTRLCISGRGSSLRMEGMAIFLALFASAGEPPMTSLLCQMEVLGEGEHVGKDGFGCALSRNLHFNSSVYLIRRHAPCLSNPDSLRGYPFGISICWLFSHSRTEVPWIDGKVLFYEIRTSNLGKRKKKWPLVSFCVMDWMFISPQIRMLNPNSWCDGVGM